MNKHLINRKKALKHLPEYATDINGYLVGSMDHSVEELQLPIASLEKEPFWDWARCSNKKRDKLYYIDYSLPYLYPCQDSDFVASIWSSEDFSKEFPHHPLFRSIQIHGSNYFSLDPDSFADEWTNQRKQFYKDNNNWERTFEAFRKRIAKNKKLESILVSVNGEGDGFSIVIPERYTGSLFNVFEESLPIMFEGKKGLVSFHEAQRWIKDIEYERFVENG